jgi:hypothetical protein
MVTYGTNHRYHSDKQPSHAPTLHLFIRYSSNVPRTTVKTTVPDKIFAALGQEEWNPENSEKSTVNKLHTVGAESLCRNTSISYFRHLELR